MTTRTSQEELQKLLFRIKVTSDGLDFIAYLETLALDNYKAFKRDDSDKNDIHKGYAIAIDSLLESFNLCDIASAPTDIDTQGHY